MGFSKKTKSLIEEYESMGYTIIIGNNPRLPESKCWQGYECVRLCQTNSKHHGYSLHTVWAVRKLTWTKIQYVHWIFRVRLDRYSRCGNFRISKFQNSSGYIVSKKINYKNCIGETMSGFEPLHDNTEKFTTLKQAKQFAEKYLNRR